MRTTTETRLTGRLALGLASLALGMLPLVATAEPLPRIEGPLTVDQAVDLARAKNLRLKAADADARAMDSMRREALAPFWPQLSANGYFNDQRMAPNVYTSAGNTMARNYQVFNADQTKDANFTAMYPLFSGGRDYYGYQAAARRAEAGQEMRRGTELDVAMQARLDYIAALREAENLGVTGDLVRGIAERLRVSREAFDAGRVPRYYLLRDEAEHANALQMEAMAQSRMEQALVALKTTLGVDLSSPITLADRLEYAPTSVSVEAGIRQAIDVHPEIKSVIKQREAAQADVRAAYGNYFPQVGLSYMYDGQWMKNRGDSSATANGYSVGVVVTLPLFDGFLRENALKTAKAKLERAEHSEGLARQQIARDINQAALMLRAAQKSVEASEKGLASSSRSSTPR
jgi:outer membrane protein